jgi:hypothetical protein
MRSVLTLALLSAVVVLVPGCLAPLVKPWPSGKYRTPRESEEGLRKAAQDTVKKFEDQLGEKPVEAWPESHRVPYTNAKRILADLEGR